MPINLHEKFSPKVAERFTKASYTENAASKEYEWDGVKTVKISSVDTVPLANYTRSGTNRMGTPSDLTDTIQVLSVEQDKGFDFYIDAGDASEQQGIKNANRALRREVDERVIPTQDKYRFTKWCKDAGSHVGVSALNKNSIIESIMDCTEKMDNALAPEEGRTMWITAEGYKYLKQNPEFIGIDSLGEKALARGQVGEVDGMKVIKVPSSYLPAGVFWLIAHKSAILAPTKLKNYKINTEPEGVDGVRVWGRFLYDAFVIGAKSGAVCVGMNASYAINTPTINVPNAGNYTMASTTTGVDIWYTTDGSDPYFSNTVHKGGANTITVDSGTLGGYEKGYNNAQTLRAVAVPNANASLFRSDVSESKDI